MLKSKVILLLTLAFFVANGLTGCASQISKDAVVVHDIQGMQQHEKTVVVKAQGGDDAEFMGSSKISNNDFAKAIEESIINSRLFSKVLHGEDSDYLLNVTIVNMSNPAFGLGITVDVEAAWSLVDVSTKQIVMRESINSSHTATVADAFVGRTRGRLAKEGAIQKNIRQGIIAISELSWIRLKGQISQ